MPLLSKHKGTKQKAMLQAVEYRHFTTLRLINLAILGFCALTIMGVALFMYQRIYESIGQIQIISNLKSQLGIETIDFQTLNTIEEEWQKKHSEIILSTNRDPFNPVIKAVEEDKTIEIIEE